MFDPNFDPYDELIIARHNIAELIRGLNHCSELLKELSNQHTFLIAQHRDSQRRIHLLEMQISGLKLGQI